MVKLQAISLTRGKVFFAFLIAILNIALLSTNAHAVETKFDKSADSSKRVLILSLPRLTWAQLETVDTPAIDSLIDRGSAGAMSVRVLGAPFTSAKGYATISAGNRSTAVSALNASFLQPGEFLNGSNAKELFINQRGKTKISNPAALAVGFEQSLTVNQNTLDKSKLGIFAEALTSKSKSIAVFGNADQCLSELPECYERSVAYVGTNTNGVLQYGDVSRDLIDDSISSNIVMDMDVVREKAEDSIKKHDVTVVECSDLERADATAAKSSPEVAERTFANALKKCDQLIGDLLESMSFERDQIYLVSTIAPSIREEKTVFIAAGNEIPKGYASSATTRIKGSVTLVDISPSILNFLDVPAPSEMQSTLFDFRPSSDSVNEKSDYLMHMNDQAVSRENSLQPFMWYLMAIFILTVVVSLFTLRRAPKYSLLTRYVSFFLIVTPIATFILQPFMYIFNTPIRLILMVCALSFVLASLLILVGNKWGNITSVFSVGAFTLLILLGDIVTGGRLQFNSIFGNATIVAGRFSGFNNQSFAILVMSAIVLVASAVDLFSKEDKKYLHRRNIILVGILILVLLLIGAPQFGSDVGGVLAFTPTLIVLSMMLFNKKVGAKTIVLAGFITGFVISAFALIDLARPIEKRTHLGRFAKTLFDGEAGLVLERKLSASIGSFSRPTLTVIIVLSILAIWFLIISKEQFFAKASNKYEGFKYLVYPALLLAITATLLNDSGATIPALMLVIALPVMVIYIADSIKSK